MAGFERHFVGWIYTLLVYSLVPAVKANNELKRETAGFNVQLMKIYEYDDYDNCHRMYHDFVYCIVHMELLPDATSVLWKSIQNYSSSPRHFDRRKIEVGSCLQKCSPSFDRSKHNVTTVLDTCLHAKIWSQYKLNSSIALASCNTAADPNVTNESWMIAAAGIVFIAWAVGALLLVIWATMADVENGSRVSEKRHCRVDVSSVLVESFSLRRNLRMLIKSDERSELNLGHLDGIRAITMMIILLSHSSIPLIRMPLKNVDQLEAQFDQSWFPLAMAGNTYTVQLFFVIGGLLLAVNMLEQIKGSSTIGIPYFIDRVKNRLIRIFPTYMFVILFHSSWYPRFYDGPIGARFKDHCADNWWINLLFINNYIHTAEPCIQFTWYLGADFQLYLFGTALMIVMWNRPKLANPIIICMVLSAFLIPAMMIYVHHLDATVMMILRYVLQEIRTLPYYTRVYIPFETNAGNYFFGMLAGIVYYNFKGNPTAASTLQLKCMLMGSAVYFVILNGLTLLLPSDHLEHSSMWLAIFGSMVKSAWGIFPSIVLLYLALQNTPSVLLSLLKHTVLRVAAKLSYSIYLLQYGIIYAVYKHITYPLLYDGFTILIFTAAILTMTFFSAVLLHLIIEAPFNTMLRKILHKSSVKKR